MILEEETFKKFGYYPKDLKSKSSKRILAKCDECDKVRETSKHIYRNLCKSCVKKGIYPSEEAKQKMRKAQQGKHLSKEHKLKLRDVRIGKYLSEETKQKMRIFHTGKHHSEETKQKIREGNKGKRRSEETKQKNSKAQSGKNHPNWQGGISFEPYCIKFNDEFKERVREFFGRRCVECNKTEEENGKKLNVHHVTYNKDTCCDGTNPLFVPLCNSCHGKTASNRKNWEKYFTEKIMNDYNGKCFISKKI